MLQALEQVVAMSDPQEMQEIAHRMNDAVSHVGGAAIRDITRAIAQDVQNEDFLAAQRHFSQLQPAFEQLQSEIQQWLAQSR
jgi:HPt (histidine-containing phosphotransfer) domain-containing protein